MSVNCIGHLSYQVDVVNSGAAALDHFSQHEPDLVLLDVGLPDTNVFEICETLRIGMGSMRSRSFSSHPEATPMK